jgi:glycerol-3-phosphate dehydrogenase
MYEEAMREPFDVAILGCGAYGFPLAAKIKAAGRQAVHMGGTTQILFGIRGRRWDDDKNHSFLNQYYSDAWVRVGEKDRPKNAKAVEDACYW